MTNPPACPECGKPMVPMPLDHVLEAWQCEPCRQAYVMPLGYVTRVVLGMTQPDEETK